VDSFPHIYGRANSPQAERYPLHVAEQAVTTMLASLGQCPKYVRYFNSKNGKKYHARALAEKIATRMHEDDQKGSRVFKGLRMNGKESASTVLILDRAFDLVTPLMDHYTHSSMILENFDVKIDDAALMYAFQMGEDPQVMLNEEDYAMQQLRFQLWEVSKLSYKGLERENEEENPSAAEMIRLGGYPAVPDDNPVKTKCLAEYLTYKDNLDEINLHQNLKKKLKSKEPQCLDLIQFQQAIAMGEKNCKDCAGGSRNIALHKKMWNILEDDKFTQAQKNKALLSYAVGKGELTKADLDKLNNYDRNDGTNYKNMVERVEETFGVGLSKKKVIKGEKALPRNATDWRIFEEVPQWSMEWPEEVIKQKNKVKLNGEQYNRWTPYLKTLCERILEAPNPEDAFTADEQQWKKLNDTVPLVGSEKGSKDAKTLKAEAAAKAKAEEEETEKKKTTSRHAGRWSGEAKVDGNLVIFIFGGYTYAELQVVYELIAKYKTNVYIGGSCMWSGKTFTQAIEAMATA